MGEKLTEWLGHEHHRVLRIIHKDNLGRTTTTYPSRNSAVDDLIRRGFLSASQPRKHLHYSIYDLEITDKGRAAIKNQEG